MGSDRLSEHLRQLGRVLRLPESDEVDITNIHTNLQKKVSEHFTSAIDHYLFGSFSINCLLPLDIDPAGDIDYLIVFPASRAATPLQLLNKIHSFCRLKLRGFSAQPNHPTILASGKVINLDLVPAIRTDSHSLLIPKNTSEWTESNPLKNAHFYRDPTSDISRCFRLFKYINVMTGKTVPPFHIRDFLVEERFSMVRDNRKPGTFTEEVRRIFPKYIRKYGIPGTQLPTSRDRFGESHIPVGDIIKLLPIPLPTRDA